MTEARIAVRPVLVLWDVDHTLIENGGVSKENYAWAFELLTGRLPTHPIETDGRTDPEIVQNTLINEGIEPGDEHLIRVPDALEAAMRANAARLRERGYALPGAQDALANLQDIVGVVQSVLTGNIRPNAFIKLSTFGLDSYIDFEVGGYGSDDKVRANLVGIARKRAQAKYGSSFDHSTTVVIGDTTRDIQAGRTGGAYTIGVATGLDSLEKLTAEGADIVFPDLRDTRAVVAAVRNLQTS
jgi:phosphoglycolate phosphatase